MYANIIFTICYGWMTGVIEAQLLALIAKAKAYDAIKDKLIGLILQRLSYFLVDSLAYAGGQQPSRSRSTAAAWRWASTTRR